MSADLIGDDMCREAFNKARQQRFSVHGLDVVCEPDIFRSGYAAGRDSEIAKRDARMAELEKELQAGATAVENCELFRAELAALKAQEPVGSIEIQGTGFLCAPFPAPAWAGGRQPAVGTKLYAAPVPVENAQVVVPERWNVPRPMWKDARQPYGNPLNHADIEAAEKFNLALDEVVRLNAAPVQQVSVPSSIRYTSDGELAECPCCGSLDVGGAHDTVNCYGCGLQITKPRPLQNAADAWNRRSMLAAPAAPAADAWIPVSERLPDVPDGDEREVIVCVKRAHNGQSYSFSARYLNNFPLHSDYEDDPMFVTGWHDVKEHAECDGWYSPLIDSSSGDEVTHWMPLPAANSAKGVL